MTEIWKDIEGFEGRYQISNLGNVKSLRYGGRDEVRNLVPKINNKGYEWVELILNGKRSCLQIHRLVAIAFIPNPYNYPIINHKDENPRNNSVDNLEWCDHKYNVHYYLDRHRDQFLENVRKPKKRKPGYHRSSNGRTRTRAGVYNSYKLKSKVAQVDKNGNVVKVWDCVRQIERDEHKSQWSITQCCNGKRKTAYGYTWHFIDAV